ncbi:MAG: hypothetical protein R3F44_01470 [Candidatus Competibacteraceae bacterium]
MIRMEKVHKCVPGTFHVLKDIGTSDRPQSPATRIALVLRHRPVQARMPSVIRCIYARLLEEFQSLAGIVVDQSGTHAAT